MADLMKPSGIKDNSRRKGVPKFFAEQRRKEAEERNVAYSKLTNGERLAKLDAGGFVATKQRAKILKQIAEGKV